MLFEHSVADVLEKVKSVFTDTLSENVYAHFGMKRDITHFSEGKNGNDKLLFPLKDSEGSNDVLVNTLTGKPVSRRTIEVLDILDMGENVDIDIIKTLPEIKEAKERVKSIINEFIRSYTEFDNIPVKQIGTYLINTEERYYENQLSKID